MSPCALTSPMMANRVTGLLQHLRHLLALSTNRVPTLQIRRSPYGGCAWKNYRHTRTLWMSWGAPLQWFHGLPSWVGKFSLCLPLLLSQSACFVRLVILWPKKLPEYCFFHRALLQKRPIITAGVYYAAASKCSIRRVEETHCSILQYTAIHCNSLQHVAHTATHVGTPQHIVLTAGIVYAPVATVGTNAASEELRRERWYTLQHPATQWNKLRSNATHCNTMQQTNSPRHTCEVAQM